MKNVLITGAAKRIGRAIALDLAAQGWAVAVHYRASRDEAEALASEIIAKGGKACVVKADLSIEAETLTLVPQAVKALGPLDALINNASIFERDEAVSVTRASWDAHMETNLRAPFVLIQEFAKQLPEGEKGAIVNLLDQRVWNLTPQFTSYTLSKAGLWTATQTLAMALAPNIRVNAIGPGPILPSARQSIDDFSRQCSGTPLGHGAKPEEIAAAVRFLLDSPSVTGQMIAVDGGQHLSNPAAFTPAAFTIVE
jgi:NAD(P)-dependent dehydrogenase (short-subunit alcohol dehydrogenase family)